MSHQARDRAVQKFGEDDAIKVLIASLKCGGVGLNLTMASKVVWYVQVLPALFNHIAADLRQYRSLVELKCRAAR